MAARAASGVAVFVDVCGAAFPVLREHQLYPCVHLSTFCEKKSCICHIKHLLSFIVEKVALRDESPAPRSDL